MTTHPVPTQSAVAKSERWAVDPKWDHLRDMAILTFDGYPTVGVLYRGGTQPSRKTAEQIADLLNEKGIQP